MGVGRLLVEVWEEFFVMLGYLVNGVEMGVYMNSEGFLVEVRDMRIS